MIHRLDLDVAIYRNRVQLTHRPTETFVDQRPEFAFSTDDSLVGHARYLEDTLVRAIRQIVSTGGFSLRDPIAHVVRCDGELGAQEREAIESALRETGIRNVVFELEE